MKQSLLTFRKRGKRVGAFGAMALVLASCGGFEGANEATERFAYRTNFVQLPLIASGAQPNRVLRMQVFSGPGGSTPRAAREVAFSAKLDP